jgi:hypothetical protein
VRRIGKKTTREQLAALASEALEKASIDAVLVGGAAVAIYTHELFPSDDLDWAVWNAKGARRVLQELGFEKVVGNKLFHPEARYYLQLVNAPPMVGRKYVKQPFARKTPWGDIRMFSPLDCVLDRLAHFFVWNDRQCLQQAAHVAAGYDVDLGEVRRWAAGEKADPQRLQEFVDRVAELKAG